MNEKIKYHVVLCNLRTQDRIEIGSNSRDAKSHLKEFLDATGRGKTTSAYCLVYDAKDERKLSTCYYDDRRYFCSSPERIAAPTPNSKDKKNQGDNKND